MALKSNQQPFFIGTLILSGIGFLLVLFTDWGGWYYYNYYGGYEVWGWVSLFTWAGFFPLFLMAGIFSFTSYISYLGLRTPEKLSDQFLLFGFLGSIVIVIINILALIIFAIAVSDSDWWLDAAFYASFIGGILNSVLFYLLRKQ
jgi:hypothetical protein